VIRVAIISEPGIAGVKRHVVDLLHHLDVAEFELLFLYGLSRKDSQYESEIAHARNRGIRCRDVGLVRAISPRADALSAFKIWLELRAFRPQVVHVHSSKAGFLGRLAAKLALCGAKVIYSPHALACLDSRFYWWLERGAAMATDVMVAVSPSEAEDILRLRLIPPHRVRCIPVCIRDESEYPAVCSKQRGALVVACGRICRQKQPLLFFEAARAILAKSPGVRFRWIGDYGDDREAEEVRRLRDTDPLAAKVEISGWTPAPDAEIAAAQVFCMTSRYESFGYVTADAMMMGVPVVGVRTSGTRDLVIDGQTGLLCGDSAVEIANSVERLLGDPVLRDHLSAAARQQVLSNFSRPRMLGAISNLYREVAAK